MDTQLKKARQQYDFVPSLADEVATVQVTVDGEAGDVKDIEVCLEFNLNEDGNKAVTDYVIITPINFPASDLAYDIRMSLRDQDYKLAF